MKYETKDEHNKTLETLTYVWIGSFLIISFILMILIINNMVLYFQKSRYKSYQTALFYVLAFTVLAT